MEYDPTQFRGAARFYRLGRAPYFSVVGSVFAVELGLDGTGHLLDVGAGPGMLGLSLAPWSERFEETLARTAFGRPRIVHAPGRTDLVRDVDTVVAGVLSMSYGAPWLFGDRLPAFVAELRDLLADASPTGEFWEWPGDTEVVIATRPADVGT